MATDGEIIAESLGDATRFAEVFERHHVAVHRFVARRAGVQLADDVLSETFLVAFERRRNFVGDGDARPWLYGIALNVLAGQRRREAKAWRGLAADYAAAAVYDRIDEAVDRLDAGIAVARLSRALRGLTASDRDTLLLYAWGDLDYEGIAQALHIPIGTVRSRLNRVRRKLGANAESLSSTTQKEEHGRPRDLAIDAT